MSYEIHLHAIVFSDMLSNITYIFKTSCSEILLQQITHLKHHVPRSCAIVHTFPHIQACDLRQKSACKSSLADCNVTTRNIIKFDNIFAYKHC